MSNPGKRHFRFENLTFRLRTRNALLSASQSNLFYRDRRQTGNTSRPVWQSVFSTGSDVTLVIRYFLFVNHIFRPEATAYRKYVTYQHAMSIPT